MFIYEVLVWAEYVSNLNELKLGQYMMYAKLIEFRSDVHNFKYIF